MRRGDQAIDGKEPLTTLYLNTVGRIRLTRRPCGTEGRRISSLSASILVDVNDLQHVWMFNIIMIVSLSDRFFRVDVATLFRVNQRSYDI